MPVTSVARTIVDIARSQRLEQALDVADAALFRGLVDGAPLAADLGRAEGRPGTPGARRVVAAADGRSESVGETRSRVAISRAGLPVPVLQWPATGPDGHEIGRVDFGRPALRTVGEFDGEIKYGRLLKPGQSAADAVYAEKRREDRIRAIGLAVVRWAWDDLVDFRPTAAALRTHFTWP
jgi:hypothetical protein